MTVNKTTPTPAPSTFSQPQFLTDFTKLADALSAPYSLPKIKDTLTTFSECFRDGAVIWRSTNRPNDVVNYRFYLRRRLDTVAIATQAGYLTAKDDKMASLITSWSGLFQGDTEQWCDFHPSLGLVKTWVNLKGRRPVEDILAAEHVPEPVRAHAPTFERLGLKLVRFVAVDYDAASMNLYFTAPGPVTDTQAAEYTALAGCSPPTDQELADMRTYLNPTGFAFAVTMSYDTGKVKRVAFYALDIAENLPLPKTANDRMRLFFEKAVSHDSKHTRNVAWSYGVGDNKYMKCESSYVGELATVLKDVGSPLSSKVAQQ